MQNQTGTLILMSVLGLGLGSLAWRFRNRLSGFHQAFLSTVEQRAPWALWYARLITLGQRAVIWLAAIIFLLFGAMAAVALVFQAAGIDLMGALGRLMDGGK